MTIATVVNNVGEVEIQVDDLDGGQSRTQCVEVTPVFATRSAGEAPNWHNLLPLCHSTSQFNPAG